MLLSLEVGMLTTAPLKNMVSFNCFFYLIGLYLTGIGILQLVLSNQVFALLRVLQILCIGRSVRTGNYAFRRNRDEKRKIRR